MKFDSFVKYSGSDGVILQAENGDKWLFYNRIGMMVPEGKSVCGRIAKMPKVMQDLIYEFEDYDAAKLIDAYVPRENSKPSELMRVFAGGDLSINITNKAFGFIEKTDYSYINSATGSFRDGDEEEKEYTALLVTRNSGDDKIFGMIYLSREEE